VGAVECFFSATMRFGRSRSSKVIDFGTNRKRVCDLQLVRHSLSCTGSEILQVFVLMIPPIFRANFGGVPVGQDRPCWGQSEQMP